jgi:hypothetical protein
MPYQTAAQHSSTIRFGSAKIEVGPDTGTLTNLGIAANIEFLEEFKPIELLPDNAPPVTVGYVNHFATVKFEMWEVNLSNLSLIRGGMDTLTTVAGSATPVTDELHIATGVNNFRLNNRNGDKSIVTSIVVKDSSNATAAINTDYNVSVDSDGFTCIARVSASTVITTGEQVKVSYSYTPNASTKLTSGGKNTVTTNVVRLTNTNSAGKVFRLTVYSAKNQNGIDLKLPSDDDNKSANPQITLKGIFDTTRTAGDQLFEIYDEQGQ